MQLITCLYRQEKYQSSHFRMLCKEHKSVFGCVGITVFLYLHVTSFGQSYSVTASFPASAVNIWHLQPCSDMWCPSSDSSFLLEHILIFSYHNSADKKMHACMEPRIFQLSELWLEYIFENWSMQLIFTTFWIFYYRLNTSLTVAPVKEQDGLTRTVTTA